MSSIRRTEIKTSRRNRECWQCGKKILKGDQYVLREVRYDKTIMSFYFHNILGCKPEDYCPIP